jgi:hypothetical protein
MNSFRLKIATWVLVPAVLLLGFPAACAGGGLDDGGLVGDNSSDAAAISLGIFVAAIIVLMIVNLKTDVENVFAKAPAQRADPRDDALLHRVSVVLDDLKSGRDVHAVGAASDAELAAGIGLRMEF